MPKITKVCVDCGKERVDYPSAFARLVGEEYRCHKCTLIKQNKENRIFPIVTYKCIDCGSEKTNPSWKFKKSPNEYRCSKCTNKFKSKDPKWIENNNVGAIKRKENPTFKENCKNAQQKKLLEDPTFREKKISNAKNISKNPKWLESVIVANRLKSKDPVWKQTHKESCKERSQNPTSRENHLISITGQGFWYGHPILHEHKSKTYCELWNQDLWNRIDSAWDYKSSISGKTKEDNKGRDLDRHHVYWQEKACCIWDEDKNGYYANINLGTKSNPNFVKYYIEGDPNKFVLLTRSEHQMIKGNKKLGTNKITWIKFFEHLVDQREKEGKVCYIKK